MLINISSFLSADIHIPYPHSYRRILVILYSGDATTRSPHKVASTRKAKETIFQARSPWYQARSPWYQRGGGRILE